MRPWRRAPGVTRASRAPGVVLLSILIALALVGGGCAVLDGRGSTHITVLFTNSTGLYAGDRVMVLGVPVGTVDSITPGPQAVRVSVSVDDGRAIPASARAAIVAPTLVTGRYVQFEPAYTGGPRMADRAVVPLDRTATPVEFDQVKDQLVRVVDDLGPTTSGQQGSLNRFVRSTSGLLSGNGADLRSALLELSRATTAVDGSGDDLFATVRNLQQFTTALARVDGQVAGFASQLATLSATLDDNRTELDSAITALDATFRDVTRLVDENRGALVSDVSNARVITKLLVDRIDTLADIAQVAPTALSNYYNIYDPVGKSLTGALVIPDLPDPRSLICALLTTVDAPEGDCTTTVNRFVANAATAGATRRSDPGRTSAARSSDGGGTR